MIRRSRKPEIMAEAAHYILTQASREFTGNFCIDDEIMESAGVTDLTDYGDSPPGARLSLDVEGEIRR